MTAAAAADLPQMLVKMKRKVSFAQAQLYRLHNPQIQSLEYTSWAPSSQRSFWQGPHEWNPTAGRWDEDHWGGWDVFKCLMNLYFPLFVVSVGSAALRKMYRAFPWHRSANGEPWMKMMETTTVGISFRSMLRKYIFFPRAIVVAGGPWIDSLL